MLSLLPWRNSWCSVASLNVALSWPLLLVPGVSKVVTVDVNGNWQRWLKVRDLTKGVTYFFRVQARTIAYGPELQANVTAGPAEGKWSSVVGPVPSTAPEASGVPLPPRGPSSPSAKRPWPTQSGQEHRTILAAWVTSKACASTIFYGWTG